MGSVSTSSPALIPTLSAVEGWSTEYLTAAASHWTGMAITWEDTFTEVANEARAPGGAQWDGAAATAAQLRTHNDRLVVIGAADELHSAAAVARAGADEVSTARQRAIAAISQARSAGFYVAEDLSVSYRGRVTAANASAVQAQAQALGASIRTKATELSTVDQRVGAKLTESAVSVAKMSFEHSDTKMLGFGPRDPKESPPTDALSVKDAGDVHERVDPLPPGKNRGVKVLPNAAAVEALYAELTKNAQPLPPGTYKGEWQVLPDGTRIGFRPDSKSGGPTVEIWNPDGSKMWDVHVGDPPNRRPPIPAPAPAPAPVPVPAPTPIPEAPSPNLDVPQLPQPSPIDVFVGGVVAVGAGIVAGVGALGEWVFSP